MNYLLHAEAIIFDLDGVIADTRVVLRETWTKWCNLNNINLNDVRNVSHGRRAIDTIKIIAPHLNPNEQLKILEEIEISYSHKLIKINGIIDLLESIGDIKWGVCTSSSRATAIAKLQHAIGFKPYCLICSEDVENGKPFPESFLKTADKLKINPEDILIFEDSKAGIEAAKNAGSKVVGVLSASHKDLLTEADYTINDFNDIKVINRIDNKATLTLRGNSKTLL